MNISLIVAVVSVVGLIGSWFVFVFKIGVFIKEIQLTKTQTDKNASEIENIKLLLASKYKDTPLWLSVKHSPRVLTPVSQKIFKEICGDEFLRANRNVFFSYIDNKKPATALQVETYCVEACLSFSNTEIFKDIQNYVYTAPLLEIEGRKVEITLMDICYILAIPLRDMYLGEHKDLNP